MNRKSGLVLILILGFSLSLVAQENVKIKKDEFKTEKEGFSEAWKSVKLGDKFYDLGGGLYKDALNEYMLADLYNTNNPELNYKIGVCCLYSNRPVDASDYFLKAYAFKEDVARDILMLTGRVFQSTGDFGKALDFYNMYSDKALENGKIDPIVNTYILECNRAIEMSNNVGFSKAKNLGQVVNSEDDDYSPIIASKGSLLYFTSRRNLAKSANRQHYDMKWDENILVCTRTNNEWDNAGPAGGELATLNNEGVLYVDEENTLMFLYAGWSGEGDIFRSVFTKGSWTKPASVKNGINGSSRETSVSVTSDGNEMFFTSDRKKGNIGGRDIYSIKRVKKGKWTKPYNLGPEVNTKKNEESVWVSVTGDTLWFSSNGLEGMGGYDIYMSVKDEVGNWKSPVNMGIPINSQLDDMFYRPSRSSDTIAYISSNRSGGLGGFDIYEIITLANDTTYYPPVDTLILKQDIIIPDSLLIIRESDIQDVKN